MDSYDRHLLRLIASQLKLLTEVAAANALFGKRLFELGFEERFAAEQTASQAVGVNYQQLEPLADHLPKEPTIGFRATAK